MCELINTPPVAGAAFLRGNGGEAVFSSWGFFDGEEKKSNEEGGDRAYM